jgi:hypothetical protein
MKTTHISVDAYIDSFPKHIQDYLHVYMVQFNLL